MKIKVITPLSEDQHVDDNCSCSIFLAGGCSTSWRDSFIKKLENIVETDSVVVFSPFCDSTKIKLIDLLKWERNHLMCCDIIVFNFEGSTSVQPGSIYELGRFAPRMLICGHVLANIDDNYKLKREVGYHIELINDKSVPSFVGDNKIEVFHSDLDKLISRCNEVVKIYYGKIS